MLNILKIIKRRSTPGILIYDTSHRLLYANEESTDLIPELRKSGKSPGKAHVEIKNLCNTVKKCAKIKAESKCNLISAVLPNEFGPPYYLRAFPIKKAGGDKVLSQIMILIEKVVLKHEVNFEDIKAEFSLTDRELEVLKQLCAGLTNKELSEKLSICEYTVKDHIKKLMQKIGVQSRTAIVTRIQ